MNGMSVLHTLSLSPVSHRTETERKTADFLYEVLMEYVGLVWYPGLHSGNARQAALRLHEASSRSSGSP